MFYLPGQNCGIELTVLPQEWWKLRHLYQGKLITMTLGIMSMCFESPYGSPLALCGDDICRPELLMVLKCFKTGLNP